MRHDSLTGKDARKSLEYLWPASLGVVGVVAGWWLIPVLIHMMGRGGQQETIEWALYMSLLVVYPPLVLLLARGGGRMLVAKASIVGLSLLCAVGYIEFSPRRIVWVALALGVGAATVALTRREGRLRVVEAPGITLAALLAATFAWIAVSGLVSWGDAAGWLVLRPQAAIVGVLVTYLACAAVRETRVDGVNRRADTTVADWIAIAVLALFSFRTFPIVEFYHWGFYIGPIEQMRQGGELLWDTPSQYGLLSILLPTILPGTAWESFWFFQSVVFAVVAAIMYLGVRKMARGWQCSLLAFFIVLTTLFFRPRSDTLLLSAQMTPSGGPVRFVPIFILLAVLMRWVVDREKVDEEFFVIKGSLIWIFAVVWSAEAAIYCSAIWFAALAIFFAQSAASWKDGGRTSGWIGRRVALLALVPVLTASAAYVIVKVVYRLVVGHSPDSHGYLEYALLYSRGGFGALPVDPTGSVWFLLLVFFAISTAGALYLTADWRNRRLVMLAALWGGAWSVGSYFTGRSHPVNVLSLAPVVLYSAALLVRTLRSDYWSSWHEVIFAVMVPAFAMPAIITLGHGSAYSEITRPQRAPSAILSQVPAMDTSLAALLVKEGAKPTDPVVMIGDGRLMLPAWEIGGSNVLSDNSWLPKPYEIIGSLPAERRNVYIDRDRVSFPGGWLIHSKGASIAGFDELHQKLLSGRKESRRLENDRWIVSWIGRR
ncbi:MAG: hypothetical protein ABIQ55_10925 [Gemmatimonadaceae bacterium]